MNPRRCAAGRLHRQQGQLNVHLGQRGQVHLDRTGSRVALARGGQRVFCRRQAGQDEGACRTHPGGQPGPTQHLHRDLAIIIGRSSPGSDQLHRATDHPVIGRRGRGLHLELNRAGLWTGQHPHIDRCRFKTFHACRERILIRRQIPEQKAAIRRTGRAIGGLLQLNRAARPFHHGTRSGLLADNAQLSLDRPQSPCRGGRGCGLGAWRHRHRAKCINLRLGRGG